jgi:uncharacterized protein YjbI with pentapeptide repeats
VPGASAPVKDGTESRPPEPQPPASDLPPIAAKADDLEAIKKAVDDAASVGGGLWLSYLFVLFYLAIAAGAVTHADLFLENPVKLPFLNVELPLLAFFLLAPILFLFVHAYTLVHLVLLTDKTKRFHQVLDVQIPNKKGMAKDQQGGRAAIRAGLRRQLPSNIFVQFLAGPRDIRESSFGWFLQGIAWFTLGVAPLLLLLLFQIQFLPFHNSLVTWTQRAALLADLILLWWLWRRILSGRWDYTRRPRGLWAWSALGLATSATAIIFSWGLATFPGEWQTEGFTAWRPIHERDQSGEPIMVSVHDWLFESRINDTTRRRRWPLSSTLVLPGFNIYEGLRIEDPEKAKWHDFVFRARGRDLKGAIFDLTTLPRVDFEGSDLRGASLGGAQLQGTSLRYAQLQMASLFGAQLQGASLDGAQLQSASLDGAQLQGASVRCSGFVPVDGALMLRCANLQDAALNGAQLQGAILDGAELEGASLGCFSEPLGCAKLQGASLNGAQLQGARLDNAELEGASLEDAWLQGAALSGTNLQSASLDRAQLQGAILDYAKLQGASLDHAQLEGARLEGAVLEATDLSGAWVWRTNAAVSLDAKPTTVHLPGSSWEPSWTDSSGKVHTWDNQAYRELRDTIEHLSPDARDVAHESIGRLDCSNSDGTLASCDPKVRPPAEAAIWRDALEAAGADEKSYAEALVKTLRELVCSGDERAVYIVRGAPFRSRLWAGGGTATDLIRDLINKDGKDCSVAAALTDDDRAKLLQTKQHIEKAGK